MKVLYLTRYTRLGASSRLRFHQFFPYLIGKGVEVEASPLFNDKYLKELYGKSEINRWNIIKSYVKRFNIILNIKRFDLIIIEKELFPYLPAVVEYIFSIIGVKYIVDYDDAIFHSYDAHPNRFVKILLENKIATVMRLSSLVVAGNQYLKEYAVRSGAQKIDIIPTVIDIEKYIVKESYKSSEIVIGWIGSPSTLKYVEMLRPILLDLSNNYVIKLRIIGGKSGIGLGENKEEVFEWSEVEEVAMIRGFDIGIMPLNDELWEYGKCGYKLIQYMGCAIPVIGSPIGVNNVIIQEGENGYKPVDLTGWKMALEELIRSESLRQRMGIKGRLLVEEHYSLQKVQEKWLSHIEDLIRK